MRRNATVAVEQPLFLVLLDSIVQLMNTEIELGLTFAQVAKTSRNAGTKARNLENARKAYEVVGRFLATKDHSTMTVGITDRLSVLREQLANLEEEAELGS